MQHFKPFEWVSLSWVALGGALLLASGCSTAGSGEPGEGDNGTGELVAVTCGSAMSVFPVRAPHNIGYDGASCGTGACVATCPDQHANTDYIPNDHHGNDVFAHRGADLVAVASGTILDVGWASSISGLRVRLRDDCGWVYFYGHLEDAVVTRGQRVNAGDLIGHMGNSGAPSVHLHFNISSGDFYNDIDPFPLLQSTSSTACGGGRGSAMLMIGDAGPRGIDVFAARSTGSAFGGIVNGRHADNLGFAGVKSIAGDFNGDGAQDVGIVADAGAAGTDLLVALGTGTGFTAFQHWARASGYGWRGLKPVAGDFNGDGKWDVGALGDAGPAGTDVFVALSTGGGFTGFGHWVRAAGYGWAGMKPVAGDFNGDGKWDVGALGDAGPAGTDLFVALSTGGGFTGFGHWVRASGYGWNGLKPVAGDFNGDGKWDVGALGDAGPAGTDLFVALSTGSRFPGFGHWARASGYGWNGLKPVAGDFNGDGKWDVGALGDAGPAGTDLFVAVSTGGGFGGMGRWLRASGYGFAGLLPVGR